MKEIDNYIFEKLKINKDSKVTDNNESENLEIVDRVYIYKTNNKTLLISYILANFLEKCTYLLRTYKNLNSTKTYEIFSKEFGNKFNKDSEFKLIYDEIPDLWDIYQIEFKNYNITKSMVDKMFGLGEFPIVRIYAKLGNGNDKFSEVFYTISR